MTVAFDQLVMGPCLAAFGEAVTYSPQAGLPLALTAIFDEAAKQVEFSEGAPVESVAPMMGVRLSDFPSGVVPTQGDAVVRAATGLSYLVKDVRPDGKGAAVLMLQQND